MDTDFHEFAEKLGTILLEKGIDIPGFESEVYIQELKKVKQDE